MDRLLHPSRALLLDQFPKLGLELNGTDIKEAIESQLNIRKVPTTPRMRPSRQGKRPIVGFSRVHRSETAPYLYIESYRPEESPVIPDPEVLHFMSFPPELFRSVLSNRSVDRADGLTVIGENHRVFVQAQDSHKPQGVKGFRDYPNDVMPPTEHDNFKVAAMRAMIRLGLIG